MKLQKSVFQYIVMPCALALATLQAPAALAHGGEDHGDEGHGAGAVQLAQPLAPRAEAKSDEVEMLAVYDDKALTLFLSRFATNEPIAGVEVEIESGQNKAAARQVADGTYKADAPWLAQPGKHGLVVTIQGTDLLDLMETTLDIPAGNPAAQATAAAGFPPSTLFASLGGMALIGLTAFGVFRRKK